MLGDNIFFYLKKVVIANWTSKGCGLKATFDNHFSFENKKSHSHKNGHSTYDL